jgi:hypothetical protein
MAGEHIENLLHRAGTLLPQHLHDAQLGFG